MAGSGEVAELAAQRIVRPGGHLADRWGVHPTLLGAVAVGGGLGLLVAAMAPRFAPFLLGLAISGSGGAS